MPSRRVDGLAVYAADALEPGPRGVVEPEAARRTAFQRDRDRLVHSVAFRRLAQKTQVFMPEEGEHHRTRLTHTLEVAQIARSIARALRLDEDLTEALALAHDFGHGPFGHTGEDALDRVLRPWGGFDHNVQSLRVVVDLERRYLDFDGLNLTWTTLEGLAKRKGPCAAPSPMMAAYEARFALALALQPSAEAQVAALADDIAYNAHDLEDGLQAGLFELDDTAAVPTIHKLRVSLERGRDADPTRLPFALARGLIDCFVTDALTESGRRLADVGLTSVAAVRAHAAPVIALSPEMVAAETAIKDFLFAHMYRHARLVSVRQKAHDLIGRLAKTLLGAPDRLPAPWAMRAVEAGGDAGVARTVADYVAGLTDRQAIREEQRLSGAAFDASWDFV